MSLAELEPAYGSALRGAADAGTAQGRVARRGAASAAGIAAGSRRGISAVMRSNRRRLVIIALLAIAACTLYMTIGVNFAKPKLMNYSLSIRAPKLAAMLITALAIGGATVVFQSIIRNNIVTPCLLGMNSLYTLVHTAIAFVIGTGSALVLNENLSFAIDLAVMAVASMLIYGWLFEKTHYNVLYVLLIGTVLTSLFGSIQSTLARVMDPNEYETLLTQLVASFSDVNASVIVASVVVLALVVLWLRRDLALLDVITLGKDQAINLGVDYDRTIRRLLLGVTLAIAVATALVGPISFLGLIIANLSRQFLRTYRHTYLVAGSALFGMVALVAGQLVSERVFHYLVPVSTFVSIVGGVYFLVLLLTTKRS